MAKGRRGIKVCPNCEKEIGGRTKLCSCGWYFPEEKLRKDLLDQKDKQKSAKENGKKGRRGIKICPNCEKKIGGRTKLCSCGWYFPEGKLRTDLLQEQKKTSSGQTYYEEEGRGRKRCPQCKKIVGAPLRICYCGFDFAAQKEKTRPLKKEKTRTENLEEEIEDIAPDKREMTPWEKEEAEILNHFRSHPHEVPKKMSKREHAERVLSLGKERALALYNYAKTHGGWKHCDWDYVGKQLGVMTEESKSEEQEEDFVEIEE